MYSKEELQKIKEDIFNDNISKEEKKEIIDKINKEIKEILSELENGSDPIDE